MLCLMPIVSSPSIRRLAAGLLLACCALPTLADIYKSVDADGRVTYSNIPMRGAKKLDLGPIPAMVPSPRGGRGSGKGSGAAAYTPPSPANFPRVDEDTQRSRDQGRRGILQEELGREQQLLADARKQASAAPQDGRLRDNVTFHEKNIEALQTEMSKVK